MTCSPLHSHDVYLFACLHCFLFFFLPFSFQRGGLKCAGLTIANILVVVAPVARAVGSVFVTVSFAVASIAASVVGAASVAAVGEERLHLFCPLLAIFFHLLRPSVPG